MITIGHADAAPQIACENSVCQFEVNDESAVVPPCDGTTLTVTYSQANGATAIQCENTSGTAPDNGLLVFDRKDRSHPAYAFDGGRMLPWAPDQWRSLMRQGVPDTFGTMAVCSSKLRAPKRGEWVIGVKRPREDGERISTPYCYDLYLITSDKSGWSVLAAPNVSTPALTSEALATWDGQIEKLRPWLHEASAIATAATLGSGKVIADKAYLNDAPKAEPTKMYLIRGDEVEVLDASRRSTGWIKIRYVTKTGKVLEKWMKDNELVWASRESSHSRMTDRTFQRA